MLSKSSSFLALANNPMSIRVIFCSSFSFFSLSFIKALQNFLRLSLINCSIIRKSVLKVNAQDNSLKVKYVFINSCIFSFDNSIEVYKFL